MMEITFRTDDVALQQLILQHLMAPPHTASPGKATMIEDAVAEIAETEAEKPRAGTAAALLNDPTQPGQAPEAGSVAEVIAGIKMKRTASTSVSNGTGSDGDEVETAAGEQGVIAATYRGKIVVEFEDGSAEIIPGAELALVAQEDGGEKAPATNAEALNGASETGVVTAEKANALRDKANAIITGGKAKPEEVFALLGEYKAAKFDELPAHSYAAMDQALDALATVAAPSAHGF